MSERSVGRRAVAAAFLVGAAAGWWARAARTDAPAPFPVVRAGGYRFINPLIECEAYPDGDRVRPFRRDLERVVAGVIRSGDAAVVSVYFRDLTNGPWFGIGEDEYFVPASLLKVPVMLAYYRWAESEPGVLKKRLRVTAEAAGYGQLVPPRDALRAGQELAAGEMIERMIARSDNGALSALADDLPPGRLTGVYRDLGLGLPDPRASDALIRVRDYASFFRVLYNASYLSRDSSEKALELLSRSEFADGLVAGVPRGVKVAHKFGERDLPGPNLQLHDCGIVYTASPYLLCVMTRGSSFLRLKSAIRTVSAEVYRRASTSPRSAP